MRLAFATVALGLPLLLAACAQQPYPPRSNSSADTSLPPAAEAQPATAAQPEAPPDPEVFLAARQITKRGPTRDLRNAAFRYMNLRFSSGTLGSGSSEPAGQALSSPVKVTEELKLNALDQLLEAVRGLPPEQRALGASCVESYGACTESLGDAHDAPHCSGPLLICLSDGFDTVGGSG